MRTALTKGKMPIMALENRPNTSQVANAVNGGHGLP